MVLNIQITYSGVDKPLHNKPTTVTSQGDNNCYFHSIVYLLMGFQDQHFAFWQSVCDYIADERHSKFLQSYILPEHDSGRITLKR